MASQSAATPAYEKRLLELVNRDIKAARKEYFFPAPEFLCKLLLHEKAQKRDRVLFNCVFNVLVLAVVNIVALFFMMESAWYWVLLLTAIRIVLLTTRFILALHFASHLPVLRWAWVNELVLEYMLCPMMGIPCGAYSAHHIVMHHKEDNIHPWDLSSTMPYQRDNFLHFLFYWVRFEFGVWVELPYFMLVKGYYFKFVKLVSGLVMWWTLCYCTWQIRPAYALWLFLIPQFIVSFLLMFGNFSQHIFVLPKRFDDDHNLTINLIDTPYNQLTFNDGYHILHHKYPMLHWSELPKRMATAKELKLHREANAICFHNVDYFFMGIYVMIGRLDKLAKMMIPVSQAQADMDVQQRISFLKAHFTPIESTDKDVDPFFGIFRLIFGHT